MPWFWLPKVRADSRTYREGLIKFMTKIEIDAIRDAGVLLRVKQPLIAYRLLKIAYFYRPKGPSIKKAYLELKAELGIKSFVIIGNCQAAAIAQIIREKSVRFEIKKVITAHLYKEHNENIYRLMDETDYIITQNISDKFEGINTAVILNRYQEKTVRILNLHFTGFHPDWCYLPLVKGKRCGSPIGEYHNQIVIDSFIKGDSIESAFVNYNDVNSYHNNYSDAAGKSLDELRSREKFSDINMSDVIEDSFLKGECCFHTFNHPSKYLMNIQVNRVFDYLAVGGYEKEVIGESLNRTILRGSLIARMQSNLDTQRFGVKVEIKPFIKECYNIYSNNISFIEAYKRRESL